ncbi:hypothetical protein CR513_31107, partial [Mucuna pruriens]
MNMKGQFSLWKTCYELLHWILWVVGIRFFLPLVQFTYNNSFHTNIWMEPFEALYCKRCKTPLCWYQGGETFFSKTRTSTTNNGEDQENLGQYEDFSKMTKVSHSWLDIPETSTHIIEPNLVQIREDLTYEAQPKKIEDNRVKKLKGKEINLVNIMWDDLIEI